MTRWYSKKRDYDCSIYECRSAWMSTPNVGRPVTSVKWSTFKDFNFGKNQKVEGDRNLTAKFQDISFRDEGFPEFILRWWLGGHVFPKSFLASLGSRRVSYSWISCAHMLNLSRRFSFIGMGLVSASPARLALGISAGAFVPRDGEVSDKANSCQETDS